MTIRHHKQNYAIEDGGRGIFSGEGPMAERMAGAVIRKMDEEGYDAVTDGAMTRFVPREPTES